ncbi:hypothetical protein RhiJN_16523 [Ceratobasidium sp. AG-Ba]|nr:hypothetical protein RhiJN_16523 [Ceratobasidium sp. AG-Ba]
MKRRVASTSSGRVRVVSIGGRPGSSFSSSSLSGVQRVERTYSRTQTNARVREAPNLREQTLRELNAIQQQEFARLNPDALPLSDSALHQSDASHWVDEDYDNSSTCTPHAAGDDDPLDELLLGSAKGNSSRRPRRSWEERGRNQTANWAVQKGRLALALLRWKHGNLDNCQDNISLHGQIPLTVTVLAIDIFGRSMRTFTGCSEDGCANELLIRHGYLGTSPLIPTVAISIECLKLYRALRSRCSTLGMETFVKTLGDLQNSQSRSHHIEQFSCAFVIYDDLEQLLDQQLDVLLGRTDPLWRPKHNCPACSYELDGEAPLLPRKMFSMDGNNSLKRLRKVGHVDAGTYSTSYFVPRSVVDSFANQATRVRPPTPPPEHPVDSADLDLEPEPVAPSTSIGVGPTDGDLLTTTCASNWRAAQAQHNKKTPGVFDETGVFLACCRHGIVAFIVDMVQSGELAKYPMAIFQKLVEVHGSDLVIAYDIAWWNPLWKPSLGLEDFEWCERVFSSSNAVARCTRHASPSTRLRYVELHYRRWDADRQGSIARLLYQNYMQAHSVIVQSTSHLETLPPDSQVTDQEADMLVEAERTYLVNLKHEPPQDTLRVEYVTQLQALETAEANFEKHWGVSSSSVAMGSSVAPSGSREVMRQRQSARRRLNNILLMVERVEAELDIGVRWAPFMPEYIQAATYALEREYRLAVDRLELLLIQRLLELSRLNIAGTCYKMRRHLSKALQSRSRAIRTAVNRVNSLAKTLNLDQPQIIFEEVLSHQFLAEFDFLRLCREDVRKQRWAQRGVRDAIDARLRIRRAKAERTRVEIEARRLATFIADEEEQLHLLANQLDSTGQFLQACQVRSYAERQMALNVQNKVWLDKLFSSLHYDGNTSFGTPKDVYPVPVAPKPTRGGNHHAGKDSVTSAVVQDLLQEPLSEDESEDEVTEFAISEYFAEHMDS